MTNKALRHVHRQNGYGAFKRGEHCEVCYEYTGKVGEWRAEYDDDSARFFCADHVTVAFASAEPQPDEPEHLSTS